MTELQQSKLGIEYEAIKTYKFKPELFDSQLSWHQRELMCQLIDSYPNPVTIPSGQARWLRGKLKLAGLTLAIIYKSKYGIEAKYVLVNNT